MKPWNRFGAGLLLATALAGCENSTQISHGNSPTAVDSSATLASTEAADQYSHAEESTQRIKPHGENDPHMNLSADKYAMVALGHLQEGRHNEAMTSINRALNAHPESAHLFAVRSQIYAANKQKAPALADLERAINLESNNASLYVNRAAVYSSFDRDDEAMADLNRAIIIDNDMLAARFNRGSLHFIKENYDAALTDFEHCISVDPHTAAPYFNRAAVLDALGRRGEAISDIERFLQLTQDENWRQTAQTLLSQWQAESPDESKG